MAGNSERTFIMVKPDGVQRGIVGEIIKRFEAKGFKLVGLKFVWVSKIGRNLKKKLSLITFIESTHRLDVKERNMPHGSMQSKCMSFTEIKNKSIK